MAQKKKAQAGSQMKVFYGVLVAVAVVGIGAIVYAARGTTAEMATEPLELSVTDANDLNQRARGISLGAETAPVDIRVFSDFMCPACATWAGQIEPLLKTEFIEQGKVRLTYYDFPLTPGHKHSFVAARAARCAGDQNRFWEYHDRLFATQRQWSYGNDTPLDHFDQVARDVGLDVRTFSTCLRSDQHAEVVTANKKLGEMLRVGGTPTVFINSRLLDQWSNYNAVRAAIQSIIGE